MVKASSSFEQNYMNMFYPQETWLKLTSVAMRKFFFKFNFIKLNPSIKARYEPRLVKTGSGEEVENVKGL